MKPPPIVRCLPLLLALPLAACASAQPRSSAELLRIEHRWVQALQEHDTDFLSALLADGFLDSTFRGGTRTREDVLTSPRVEPRYHSIRLDDLKVRFFGQTAIVTGVNVLESVDDPASQVQIRFTDVFVQQAGRWRAVAAQETVRAGA